MKQVLLPLAIVVAALGGGLVGAGVTAAVDDDEPPATTATVAGRGVADADASLAELYERVSPSVVEIEMERSVGPLGVQTGAGTGWVYDDRHVVTNQHVVDDAQEVTVRFADGEEVGGRIVGSDPTTDVALVELDEATAAPPLERGSAASLRVGEPVIAIGSPFGLQGSLTSGVVSGLGRTIQSPSPQGFAIDDVIQTDAALNPGNSGGPLLTLDGSVVGMNAQIASQTGSNSGVGYAIPVETVDSVVEELQTSGEVRHAYLGVSLADVEDDGGARVVEAVADGPAARAGIREGDVIVRAAGEQIRSSDDVREAVNEREPGDELELTVRRAGDEREVTVELGNRPRSD